MLALRKEFEDVCNTESDEEDPLDGEQLSSDQVWGKVTNCTGSKQTLQALECQFREL